MSFVESNRLHDAPSLRHSAISLGTDAQGGGRSSLLLLLPSACLWLSAVGLSSSHRSTRLLHTQHARTTRPHAHLWRSHAWAADWGTAKPGQQLIRADSEASCCSPRPSPPSLNLTEEKKQGTVQTESCRICEMKYYCGSVVEMDNILNERRSQQCFFSFVMAWDEY